MKRATIPTTTTTNTTGQRRLIFGGVAAVVIIAIGLAVGISATSGPKTSSSVSKAQQQLTDLINSTNSIASSFKADIDACKKASCLYTVGNNALNAEGAAAAKIIQSDFPSNTTTPLDNYLTVVEALQKTYLAVSEDESFGPLASQLSTWQTQLETVKTEGPDVLQLLG